MPSSQQKKVGLSVEDGVSIGESLLKTIEDVVRSAFVAEGVATTAEVNVAIVSPATIRMLNLRFMDEDKVTDVLSFNQNAGWDRGSAPTALRDRFPGEDGAVLGEIALCIEQAQVQAKQKNHSLEYEVAFLTAHAFLHLIGYDHVEKDEEMVMNNRTKAIVKAVGLE